MKNSLLALIILFSFPAIILNANGAENSQTSIGVSPAIVDTSLNLNDATTKEVTLFNLTDKAIPIKATIEGFSPQDKIDIPKDKLEIYDASSWIKLSDDDTNFILKPQELKTVKLVIQQPKNASPGGHYATIFFQPLVSAEEIKEDNSSVLVKVGTLILMQVPGNILEDLELKDFTTNNISETSNLSFSFKLINKGNTHLLPEGKINIKDELTGNTIGSINLANEISLPGIEKTYSYSFETNKMFAKLSAQIEVTYGASNKDLKSENLSIILAPYKLIIILPILIILIFLLRKRLLKATKLLLANNSNESVS